MPYMLEIERKFLVHREKLPDLGRGRRLTQGYLSFGPKATVRVRIEDGEGGGEGRGWLTIKGKGLVGRDEFEYEIPAGEAREMLKLSQASLVTKVRYEMPVEGDPDLTWEIDVFEGDNEGLIVAELELPHEGRTYPRPDWLGLEVTEEPAYKNALLAQKPFRAWERKPTP